MMLNPNGAIGLKQALRAPMLGSHLAVRLEGTVLAIFWVLSDVCDREERRDGHER